MLGAPRIALVLASALLAACATARAAGPGDAATARFEALVAAPDRTPEDRALDAGRKPAALLAFLQVAPGQRVAEIGAADGYTAELLARAVAPGGTVYAQNPKIFVQYVGDAWPKRLARPAMKDVVRVDREFDDPLPPGLRGLDLVVMNTVFHDTYWMRVDRGRMLRNIHDALKPGGALVVIDSTAKPGSEPNTPYELHRVKESWVRSELEAAGFSLDAEGSFLRNPADTLDWNPAPNEAGEKRGTSDRFAFRYVKKYQY
jgi:predicted methyltransferase